MNKRIRAFAILAAICFGAGAAERADLIQRNGKVVTVDDRFTYFMFQEANLGSLQPGKYADLLVLDRDYLTVPVDRILDIAPSMTMVGGKIVYEAARAPTPPKAIP